MQLQRYTVRSLQRDPRACSANSSPVVISRPTPSALTARSGQSTPLPGAPAVSRGRCCRRLAARAFAVDGAPRAVRQLEQSNSTFQALRQSQAAVVQQLTADLGLAPAAVDPAATTLQLRAESDDGASAAAARAFSGPGVRWLSASTLASAAKGFGGTTVTGFAAGGSDVPHLMLEQTLAGGQVLLCAGLLSRRDWVLDEAYVQRYLGSVPPGATRSYNDLSNEALQRPGWRRYQSPELGMKPVLSAALAFTFDETEENLELSRQLAAELAQLWAALVARGQQEAAGDGGSGGVHEAETVQRYDARYIKSVLEDPGNKWAAKLFGWEATNRLLAAMHGRLDLPPRSSA